MKFNIINIFLFIILITNCSEIEKNNSTNTNKQIKPFNNKKILYVDSYHPEYEHSINCQKGLQSVLNKTGIELKIIYMDAKRKKSNKELKTAAVKVKEVIDSWKPDLLIAADDAASKHLVQPYYKNSSLPIVFIGVNWSVKSYGYPYKNVTGQIEIEQIKKLINELFKHSKGKKIGILTGNTLTDKKSINFYKTKLGINFHKTIYVNNFKDWKIQYKSLQKQVDILILRNNTGIKNWNNEISKTFIFKNTQIPTGTTQPHHIRSITLQSFTKKKFEFGEYAGKTAIQILSGKKPGEIPISTNKQFEIYLNMSLAKKLNIKFPMELIENAIFIEEIE